MRLKIDTTTSRFLVTKNPEPKLSFDTGAPRLDPATGLAQFAVQLLALDESGGEILTVTVVGDPKLAVTQAVTVTGLVAIPWSQGDRSGVAFRADSITAADATATAAARQK
ncbi:hypothetical protein J8M97_25410 [Gordonia polyisoprenivorans]|uniref:hypothetical protein n=1 Tax=Gordonia polyisoprenivorans TaxID=84595 RepID=UPI00037D3826|nr:hypothetical protein [Gordonia polyisoprenivorans]QUD82950.1 hypothetical protein J8M97_25410 [Gordonia polyisoprenivorans]